MAGEARSAEDRAQPCCPHPPSSHSYHTGSACATRSEVTMRPPRPRLDAAGLAQRQPEVDLVEGGQRAARLPASCSALSPHSRAGPILWVAHSACRWPAEDCAQLGCPHQPRAHHFGRSPVLRALRCAGGHGESHGDRSAPTKIWWAAQRAWPAADRKQLGCSPARRQ